jgi:hypothetical protein
MTLRNGKRLAGSGLLCLALGLVAAQLGGCATSPRGGGATLAETAPDNHGIEILGLRQASAGYMIDFRYRVLDPEKAAPLLDHKVQPYLLDPASGAKLFVPSTPKLGQLRQTPKRPVAGDSYFMFFANPGRFARPGQQLTLVAGDLRLENLTVR